MVPLALSAEVIGAAAAVVIIVPTVVFGVLQYRSGRFRPKVQAWLAESGDSLRIKIANDGNAEGTIHKLEFVDAKGRRIVVPGAGQDFKEFKLAAGSARELDFNAPAGRDFETTDTVVARWGKHEKRLSPTPTPGSFHGGDTVKPEPAPPPD